MGGDVCPGTRTCAAVKCSEEFPGFITRNRLDQDKTICNKYGCKYTCCHLKCELLDNKKDHCVANKYCKWSPKTNLCREHLDCGLTSKDKDKKLLLTTKGLAT